MKPVEELKSIRLSTYQDRVTLKINVTGKLITIVCIKGTQIKGRLIEKTISQTSLETSFP